MRPFAALFFAAALAAGCGEASYFDDFGGSRVDLRPGPDGAGDGGATGDGGAGDGAADDLAMGDMPMTMDDLVVAKDLTVVGDKDLAMPPPADLAMQAPDMAMPPADLAMPPADMAMAPADLAGSD